MGDGFFRWALEYAQQYGLPSRGEAPLSAGIFRHPDTEDKKLRKDPTLEVLALKVPFGNRVALLNEVPWPGRLRTLRSLKR